MRLWSLHPRYLDRQGLTACWREALLAQAVLAGRTRGYKQHPQLVRFRQAADPLAAVGAYLEAVAAEAAARGYRFDRSRIDHPGEHVARLPVSSGQLSHERAHLMAKLRQRSPDRAAALDPVVDPEPHPLFVVGDGPVADWEAGQGPVQGPVRGALR